VQVKYTGVGKNEASELQMMSGSPNFLFQQLCVALQLGEIGCVWPMWSWPIWFVADMVQTQGKCALIPKYVHNL